MEFTSLKSLWQVVTTFGRERPEERRRESRLPAHGPAIIVWDVEGESGGAQEVNLLGVSEHGCSFRSTESFTPGQKILMEQGNQTIEAVIRHATADGQEYIIGVEMLIATEPSEDASQPTAEVTTDQEG